MRRRVRSRAALVAALVATAAADAEPPLPAVAPIEWRQEYRGDPADELAALQQADYGGLAADAEGNVYLGFTGTHYDLADPPPLPPHVNVGVAKFSPAGDLVWTRLIDALPEFEYYRCVSLVTATDGNLLVAGDLGSDSSGALLANVSPDGVVRWAKELSGTSSPVIAAGPSGSVVVGVFSGADDRWRIARFDSAGGPVFDVRFGFDLSVGERPTEIAVDDAGNAFVFGYAPERRLVKFGPAGARAWDVAPGARAFDLEGDGAGGVLAAEEDGITVRSYASADGAVRWVRTLAESRFAEDVVRAAGGRFVATGSSPAGAVTALLEANGDVVWTRTWNSSTRYGAGPAGVAVDGTGGIHVAARSSVGLGDDALMSTTLLAYDAAGTLGSVVTVPSRWYDTAPEPALVADGAGGVAFGIQSSTPIKRRGEVHHALVVRSAGAAASSSGKVKMPVRASFGGAGVTSASKFKLLKLKNTSRTDRLVVRVAPAAAPFSGGGGEFDLLPGATLPLVFGFDPEAAGSFTQALAVTTSDPSRPTLTLTLSGKGK